MDKPLFVMAGKVNGYGPLRLQYTLELGRRLAGEVARFDATVVELRALSGAMRDARKANKAVPALRVGILRRSRRKQAAAEGNGGSTEGCDRHARTPRACSAVSSSHLSGSCRGA